MKICFIAWHEESRALSPDPVQELVLLKRTIYNFAPEGFDGVFVSQRECSLEFYETLKAHIALPEVFSTFSNDVIKHLSPGAYLFVVCRSFEKEIVQNLGEHPIPLENNKLFRHVIV